MERSISTDRELYALKPGEARYERAISKTRGLSILVHPNGMKTFVVRYKAISGERRRLPIGEYPHMSLAEARVKSGQLRYEIAIGADPAGERIRARKAEVSGNTVADLAEAIGPPRPWVCTAGGKGPCGRTRSPGRRRSGSTT